MLLNAFSIILNQVLTYFELTNSVNFITIFIVVGALLKVRSNLSHNKSCVKNEVKSSYIEQILFIITWRYRVNDNIV